MAKINSKKKGNRFENEMSKRFSTEFNNEFRRVPNSGAYTGGKNRETVGNLRSDAKEILAGDLIAPIGFPFLIETKNYNNDPAFHKILQGSDPILDKWIVQNDGDANFVNKESLIVFRINRKGEYAVVAEDCEYLHSNFEVEETFLRYKNKIIVSLDTFFNIIQTDVIMKLMDNEQHVDEKTD